MYLCPQLCVEDSVFGKTARSVLVRPVDAVNEGEMFCKRFNSRFVAVPTGLSEPKCNYQVLAPHHLYLILRHMPQLVPVFSWL